MFGPIGMPELIVIFVIALIIFGPRKLPELGKSLGKSLAEFKRASSDLRQTLEEEIRVEDAKPTSATGTNASPPEKKSESRPSPTDTDDADPPKKQSKAPEATWPD